jgi:hypothetical protein
MTDEPGKRRGLRTRPDDKMDLGAAMNAFQAENDTMRGKNPNSIGNRRASTVRQGNYKWSKSDDEIIKTAKEMYGVEVEVELLRLALVALVTRRLPSMVEQE